MSTYFNVKFITGASESGKGLPKLKIHVNTKISLWVKHSFKMLICITTGRIINFRTPILFHAINQASSNLTNK